MIHSQFSSVWIVVVAVEVAPGEAPKPVTLGARETHGDAIIAIDQSQLQGVDDPPYPTGAHALLVTIDGQNLAAAHVSLGWRMPERIIDILLEHRNARIGNHSPRVGGLAGALLSLGKSSSDALAIGPTRIEIHRLLSATQSLFSALGPHLDVGRALLRGRYLCAVAEIEATGVPVDRDLVARLAECWELTKARVVEIVDQAYGVYSNGHLDMTALETCLDRLGISWPRVPSGSLDLRDDTFRDMARAYPIVRPLKEVRTTLSAVNPEVLAIGSDGRNRVPLRPFASRTGRNQPSATKSVFGTAAWVRNLIRPMPETGLALIDWSQQEFGIAAALSRDDDMLEAYCTGDPYLALAVMAGAAPSEATSVTHAEIRNRYKLCALGLQYGMGAATLARLTGRSEPEAKDLQRRYRATFPKFWRWSNAVEDEAFLSGHLTTVFGWRVDVGVGANPRMLRNFPLQANGAEMLRLACCLVTEAGIRVCMPLHDALLIEAPLREFDDTIRRTQEFMAEASRIVLDGFELRSEVKAVRAPEPWRDPRGIGVWQAVECALREQRARTARP